jgi:hypothetical protein
MTEVFYEGRKLSRLVIGDSSGAYIDGDYDISLIPGTPGTITPGDTVTDGTGSTNTLILQPTANKGASISTGGCLKILNTDSNGVGLLVYSNQATPSGRLVVINAAHATFNQAALRIEHGGTGRGLDVNQSGTGIGANIVGNGGATANSHALAVSLAGTGSATSSAASFSSTNQAHSALQVTGNETGRGTIKIAHVGQGAGVDANASALSIDVDATAGTAAKGIYIVSTGGSGTTGALLDVRNNGAGDFLFQVQPGQIIFDAPGSDPGTSLMWNGSWNAYLNEAGNTLVFKVKYAGGTIKSGTVALA